MPEKIGDFTSGIITINRSEASPNQSSFTNKVMQEFAVLNRLMNQT